MVQGARHPRRKVQYVLTTNYAKKCKEKGDWCEKHDHADRSASSAIRSIRRNSPPSTRPNTAKNRPPMKGEKKVSENGKHAPRVKSALAAMRSLD